MSHAAIAAVLERDDLSTRERLVAFSLASFANSDHLAWPGTSVAAARAGLPKSRYVEARDALARRGLIVVQDPGRGRARSSTVSLEFARRGPWYDGSVNAKLLEAVLGHSQARGAARLLLAALATVADDEGTVDGLSTEEVRDAAGLSDTTYRRARTALLASGELDLLEDGGGRSRMNSWHIAAAGRLGLEPRPAAAHGPVAARSAPVGAPAPDVHNGAGGQGGGVSPGPGLVTGGVSGETPPQTPPQTPPLYVRAGSNALNPGTQNPPGPPNGGTSPGSEVLIEEWYTTLRGRNRRRLVAVDLDAVRAELTDPTAIDREDWARFREAVAAIVSETTYEVWFAPLTLGGVDRSGSLTVVAPGAARSWLVDRFADVVAKASERTGRAIVIADEAQTQAISGAERTSPARLPSATPPSRIPRSSRRRARGTAAKSNKEVG